jgi:hypothetical protein
MEVLWETISDVVEMYESLQKKSFEEQTCYQKDYDKVTTNKRDTIIGLAGCHVMHDDVIVYIFRPKNKN